MQLEVKHIISLTVQCTTGLPVNETGTGQMQVIPITGGHFDGEISGNVVAGGADWNTMRSDKTNHVFAKYLLKTDTNHYISVENEGIIGETEQVIKTTPRFQADTQGPYAWLNSGVYVASLQGGGKQNEVKIEVYQML